LRSANKNIIFTKYIEWCFRLFFFCGKPFLEEIKLKIAMKFCDYGLAVELFNNNVLTKRMR
jgi:hypothetical protein